MHSHPPNNNGEAPHHKASPLFFRPNFFLSLYAKKISTPQVQNAWNVTDSVFIKKDAGKDEATVEKSKWEYEQEKDELRNATTYLARVRSTNTIDFGFPFTFDTQGLEWNHF